MYKEVYLNIFLILKEVKVVCVFVSASCLCCWCCSGFGVVVVVVVVGVVWFLFFSNPGGKPDDAYESSQV
jgi:hypothetical protein